jgi:sec-independent protein translocase protein TatB
VGSLGLQEIVIIVLVILFVFGPERLPEFAREAGKFIARFRKESARSINELKRAADIDDLDREIKNLSRDLRDVRSSVSRALTADPKPKAAGAIEPPAADVPEPEPPPIDPDAT